MTIYGAAIIAGCMFVGSFIGDALGGLMGIDANVGGVGFSMLFLILITGSDLFGKKSSAATSEGLEYWQSMYIPVVAAMTASQNVVQAVSGGVMAVLAGLIAVAVGFALLPVLNNMFKSYEVERETEVKGE
ncbi:MAG TPA: malonate transporter subunit MadL [Bacillota bacterium]|nr:malonate transporter subunit MadL [Clostridiaceae bacterium]HNR03216.1 malonate transporter subunit MadL [Bacillota bacterium]HNT02983.1 malonate transporter subunit MadL [Bacillota bacterium]HPA54093.1 malonate transporter subunit MadL [Bacillota bacterium]HPX67789.1 malonate transporter subunit MadL [Bacillota bacterium]